MLPQTWKLRITRSAYNILNGITSFHLVFAIKYQHIALRQFDSQPQARYHSIPTQPAISYPDYGSFRLIGKENNMLELVDLSKQLPKKGYKDLFRSLQIQLSAAQREAHEAGIPVIVVFEGWEAAGKGSVINRLVQRLDPRGFKVHPISAPNDEEKHRPFLWRFATRMPERGRMAIFDRSWYGRVLVERVEKIIPKNEWRQAYEEILQFERQMTDDGAVIVKFWMHISKKEQNKRFRKITADPSLSWKVGKAEKRAHKQYAEYQDAVEDMLEKTSTVFAPWTIVEAEDYRYGRAKVLETLLTELRRALDERKEPEKKAPAVLPEEGATTRDTLLDRVDLSQALEKPEYSDQLAPLQKRLRQLEHEMYLQRLPAVIVYEGWDAGGKGGNIKRLAERLDPRGYEVIPIAAPTGEELAHHYLWRFWEKVPKGGHLTVFDRSWYGRLMVERVEGFCTKSEWQRAFQEINEFEHMLASFGTVIVKLWIHISQDEQLRRFKEREVDENKKWKLTDEDWRNREKWPLYHEAVVDMLQRTSTTYAPWTIVEGNNKYFARIRALKTVVKALEAGLKAASKKK
jgi:AMP-polyphosphate phosphotransferase